MEFSRRGIYWVYIYMYINVWTKGIYNISEQPATMMLASPKSLAVVSLQR